MLTRESMMKPELRHLLMVLAFLGVGCTEPTSPEQVALEFRSFNPPAILETVTMTPQPSALKIDGSYAGAACGAVGAFAERRGTILRLVVGPTGKESECDAARVLYAYNATLFGIEPGRYTVEVFHRTNGGEEPLLASRDVAIIQ
jgi:hypothetical protein